MDDVNSLLKQAGCADYAEVFQRNGYDSAGHLLAMGPNDLKQVQATCGVLPGHMHRLIALLGAMNYRAHVVHGGEEQSAAAAPAASAETVPVLRKVHDTWAQARLASYQFSTQCGCKSLLDNKACGGKRKIIRCSSALSKKKQKAEEGSAEEDEKIPCPHMLYWKRGKKSAGAWVLDEGKSHLGHTPFCGAIQQATRMELVNDPTFVKHVTVEKKVTGPSAAKNAIGGKSGRMDGSVTSRTARRAANDVMRYHDKDYKDDWSKLEGWKREYERKNPQSRCVFQDNPLSRGIKMYGPIVIDVSCVCVWAPVGLF